jgi:hypothetical protein
MKIDNTRVSTEDQNRAMQIAALKSGGSNSNDESWLNGARLCGRLPDGV